MTEIRFYHLEQSSVQQALPALVSKAYQSGERIFIRTQDEDQTETLNSLLWTYNSASFIPHGSEKDGNPTDQPVFLSHSEENKNHAKILFDVSTHNLTDILPYHLVCKIFDGSNAEAVAHARKQWKSYKEQENITLTYWQQTPQGWDKKS